MAFGIKKLLTICVSVISIACHQLQAQESTSNSDASNPRQGRFSFLRRCPAEDPGTLFLWRNQSPDASLAGLDEPIVTDRPDFTEASTVVGLGVAQLESGYTYIYDNDGANRTIGHSYPETLLRVGILANWLEFRTAWNYSEQAVNNIGSAGAEDLYLGFKVGLTAQDGILPEMALIPQMTVPSGARAFSNGETLSGVNWLYGWDINDFLATGGSSQFNRAVDGADGSIYTEYAQSWTINYSLADRVGAFTEWFALFPDGATSARTQHYVDGGFTFLSSDNIQWDIRGGKGLSDNSDDYFFGAGLSMRFQ